MAKTLWADLLPWLRPGAPDEMPEPLRVLLQRLRYGEAARIPKQGQLPLDLVRGRVRELVSIRIEQGMSRRAAIVEVAESEHLHPRTVSRWTSRGSRYRRPEPED